MNVGAVCVLVIHLVLVETLRSQSEFQVNVQVRQEGVLRVCLSHFREVDDIDIDEHKNYNHINIVSKEANLLSDYSDCTFGYMETEVNNADNIDPYTFVFPLDFKWPGSFTLVVELWQSSKGAKGGSGMLGGLIVKGDLMSGRSWRSSSSFILKKMNTRPLVDLRLMCGPDHFGPDCSIFCMGRDDNFGHYICDNMGNKQCLAGWTHHDEKDVYCTKAICSAHCHPIHGWCNRPGECRCKRGWMGARCDQCRPYPGCQHGHCLRPFECQCNLGWGGLFCNEDLNYCTNNAPCGNKATCLNTGKGSYTCLCPRGRRGRNCQLEEDVDNVEKEEPMKMRSEVSCSRQQVLLFSDALRCACSDSGFEDRRCQANTSTTVSLIVLMSLLIMILMTSLMVRRRGRRARMREDEEATLENVINSLNAHATSDHHYCNQGGPKEIKDTLAHTII